MMCLGLKWRPHTRMLLIGVALLTASLTVAADSQIADKAGPGPLAGIDTLDLETAQRISLAENPSFAAVSARVEQARARLVQARAAYFPRLDASGSAARVTLSDNDFRANLATATAFNPAATVDESEDYYGASLTASWVLFNGFERHYTHATARYGFQLSRSAQKDAKRLLLSAVSSAYYAAQLAMESIDIAEADESFNQRQLMEAKARRRVGTGSLSDELNFQVRVNAAKAQVIQARQVYEQARFGLAALLGIEDAAFPRELKLATLTPETTGEMTRPSANPLVEVAQQARPDIAQARFAKRQADALVGVARSRFFPALNLSASLDGDWVSVGDFEGDDFGNTLAVSFSYPLFAGGANRARLNEAKAGALEAERNLENLTLSVKAQVRSATAKVMSAQDQLKIQRANAALVQRNRDLVEKEYTAGQGSLVRLNQAQRDLITAQSRLALALVSLRQAWYDLQTKTAQILSGDGS